MLQVIGNIGEKEWLRDLRVLVTGAAGTVGSELIRQLITSGVAEIRGLDNNETELFFLTEQYRTDPRVQIYLGDIRDADLLERRLQGIDVVFHAAALKHVPLCERSPFEVVQTNILGVQNLIRAAFNCHIKRVIFTSSDKAVNPTNVMGTSKLMGERLMTAAHAQRFGNNGPIFLSTRFGNIAGSRGSVIPLFCRQIAAGGPITLTHRAMTRFIMTLDQAVHLVLESARLACGGEVFITKMPVVRINDLAEMMIRLLAPCYGYNPKEIEINEIGPRSGEKFYEELMNEEEVRRSLELDDFFVILPAFENIYQVNYKYPGQIIRKVTKAFRSDKENPMTLDEINRFLLQPGVLPNDV